MLPNSNKVFIILFIVITVFNENISAQAQNISKSEITSLRAIGFNNRFIDSSKSLHIQEQALEIAKQENNLEEMAISYAYLALTHLTLHQILNFNNYADSVLDFSSRIINPRVSAFANLCKGLKFRSLDKSAEAMESFQIAYKLFHQIKDYENESKTAIEMARLLSSKGLKQWEPYANIALNAAVKANNPDATLLARLLRGRVLYEKATIDQNPDFNHIFNYYEKTIQLAYKSEDSIYAKSNIALAYHTLAGLYLEVKSHYDEHRFLVYLDTAIELSQKHNVTQIYRNALGMKGEYYANKGDFRAAEDLYKEGIRVQLSQKFQDNITMALFYNSLKEISKLQENYKAYVQYDSLFQIFNEKQYNEVQEQILQNANVRFNVERKESLIKTLEHENALQKKNKQLGYGIAALLGIGLVLMFSVSSYRRNYNKQLKEAFMERQKAASFELMVQRQETTEALTQKLSVERKLLQSQMDPHFVFNALGNIQSFILQNDKPNAMAYLASFSKLMRQILVQSKKELISIEEETESLKNYVLLQQLRLNNCFDYSVTIDPNSDQSCSIPPMLIQPFVENAIEHGLKPLESNIRGKLSVRFRTDFTRQVAICVIKDNGVGVIQSLAQKENDHSEHESMSTEITKQRMEQMMSATIDAKINIKELRDELKNVIGTQVELTIPIND